MLEKLPHAIGQALSGLRAGAEKAAFHTVAAEAPATLRVTSDAFADTAPIPARYTADGDGLSPPLAIAGVPDGAAALVLFVEDPDAPSSHPFVHLIAWNLRLEAQNISEGAFASPASEGSPHDLGRNSFQKDGWLPPDPPTGHGPHHYLFQVFALARPAELPASPGRGALLDALRGNVIAKGMLTGTYERA
ncbi:YbhB/YbcL family Raf kinase inhibitor-like protein [Methylorubrum extorquens]|uniref:YbhB/YbcL family Raf kinase inhibitor-like protein n=1 Tax=Methylorubrum extorquens TaxID=408 RepID=UPI0001590656|nr:YbhB/YbcL family Raf kinase inhibitor-like protein [Methylorubrum extorquens]ABY29365.1 PEBP family protein [Methylorubrum extorquens PA1]KQP89436.1 phosphatidylethanolamine-binding protein [Methylobacterium sp. Leaf119]WIU40705.1 YbhB/YbcL family Raf kinase inhibitor-like protein [Methylorubrum extorquens]